MTLSATVETVAGALAVAATLRAADGETLVLLGPNGAGKTTLLRAVAGLAPLTGGRVEVDGEVWDDVAGGGRRVPPDRRAVGMVFQDAVLFPHLSALDNAAFGLVARGVRRGEARARAARWLDRVGVPADHHAARPHALSGGQAQRVALARALAVEPRLLLLDEPLAGVDVSGRAGLRRVVRDALAGFAGTAVLVTHDPVEALALADRLVVVEGGRVVQEGTADEVRARPRSRYVADLAGVNLFRGTAAGDRVDVEGGGVLAAPGAGQGPVLAVVHPRAVALHPARPEGTPRNVWEATVDDVDPEGDRARVLLAGPLPVVAEVTAAAVRDLGLTRGARVWVAVKATEVIVYPA